MENNATIPVEFLKQLEETFINLVNEGRPFKSKLEKLRSFLYLDADKDYIIITNSKQEVESLHLLIRENFEDWDVKRFSVCTNDYNHEWVWTLKDSKLSGSSGYNCLKRHKENNPNLPVVKFSQFLTPTTIGR